MRAQRSVELSFYETVPLNCRTEWEEKEGGKVRAQYSVEPRSRALVILNLFL